MKLLLHTCCAPCLIYPVQRLKEKGFEVAGLFYNPNIHPFSEYKNRKKAVEDFSGKSGMEVISPEYFPSQYFQEVHPRTNWEFPNRELSIGAGVNLKEENPGRCALCWTFRLKVTAKMAKEKGCGYFSTTLLVSPYQDQELLKKIGEAIAEAEGVNFYYEDFRPGFRQAHEIAKEQGIYCQKYCGCIYSMSRRLMERKRHKS